VLFCLSLVAPNWAMPPLNSTRMHTMRIHVHSCAVTPLESFPDTLLCPSSSNPFSIPFGCSRNCCRSGTASASWPSPPRASSIFLFDLPLGEQAAAQRCLSSSTTSTTARKSACAFPSSMSSPGHAVQCCVCFVCLFVSRSLHRLHAEHVGLCASGRSRGGKGPGSQNRWSPIGIQHFRRQQGGVLSRGDFGRVRKRCFKGYVPF
jgi:hypothetical protein